MEYRVSSPLTRLVEHLKSSEAVAAGTLMSTQCLRAGDNLHYLLGNFGLAHAVRLQREVADHLLCVLGRVSHRGHPGAVLARGALEQRAVDGDLDEVGKQSLKDLLGPGLVDPQRSVLGDLAFPRSPRFLL